MFARMLLTVAVLAGFFCAPADAAEPTIEQILTRWAAASRQGPRLSPAVLRTRYGAVHSAHELGAASVLLGAVDVKELQQRFAWRVEPQSDGTIRLIGQPSDTVDQLFYSQLEITVDASTGLPASIHFVSSDGTPRPVAIRQRRPRSETMVLQVAAADAASAPVVHTAAFVSPATDGGHPIPADVDIEQVLRKWKQYQRRHQGRSIAGAAWIDASARRGTAHARGTIVSPAGGYSSTVTLETLAAVGGEPSAAGSHVDSAESMAAVTRLFGASAEQLISLYEWNAVSADESVVVLEARPRTGMGAPDRFLFQLAIEPATGLARSISIRDRRLHPGVRPIHPPGIPVPAETEPQLIPTPR
ncbi:MAG: hypothetical protein ACF8TS_10230, partial [Maioricimonas sp. JB049]